MKEYTHFSVAGKRVKIPYCIVKQSGETHDPTTTTRTTRFRQYSGKGTPEEIRTCLLLTAAKKHFDVVSASSAQIHQFMLENGIGIDCSGFVYNVLDRYLRKSGEKSLGQHIVLYPGLKGKLEQMIFSQKRVRQCSAMTLTSDLNTIPISNVREIQPGDMIRFTLPTWTGKHIAIITEVTKEKIVYAHSGERSMETGPHTAVIKITHPLLGLEKQDWLEKLNDGTSYRTYGFHPEKGDSVRRLCKNLLCLSKQNLDCEAEFHEALMNVVDKIIEGDIAPYYNLKTSTLPVFKKILYFVATTPPSEINVGKLSKNLDKDFTDVTSYVDMMTEGGLLRYLLNDRHGYAFIRNAHKVFMNNPNLTLAIARNIGHEVEIGGKNKGGIN